MTEDFYHYQDDTIFHGVAGNPKGFSFADCRALTDDNEKLKRLQERLTGFYISGLTGISHPFTTAILTCVGIEVLGQVILGFDSKGHTVDSHTIQVSMDWCKSVPLAINVSENATVSLKVETQFLLLATLYCFFRPSKVFKLVGN